MHAVTVETDPTAVAAELSLRLERTAEEQVGPRNTHHFVLSVRDDDGQLVGGLVGESFWNTLYIHVL